MKVGIEDIRVYPTTMSVSMRELVEARGGNVEEVCGAMMIDARSVNPPWEDPVTMAVQACNDLLEGTDRSAIKLLLVGSESGPDQEKSLSTWIQRYAGLGDDCRNLEIKHACYAGTGALMMACHWLAGQPEGSKALVVTTDQSREHFGKPYEFVMGGGAVAMLVSRDPKFLSLDLGYSGFYTYEVADLTRPTSRVEAGHSETSLLSYLDAVDITFDRFLERFPETISSSDELKQQLPYQIYHAPFGGITMRAHRALWRTLSDFNAGNCRTDFAERVAPTLTFNRKMGGTYASSIFISLLGCVEAFGEDVHQNRVGIYSYGSGSSAEYYSGVFGDSAVEIASKAKLSSLIEQRFDAGVEGYEQAESARTSLIDLGDYVTPKGGYNDLYSRRYAGERKLVFEGMTEYERRYRWADE